MGKCLTGRLQRRRKKVIKALPGPGVALNRVYLRRRKKRTSQKGRIKKIRGREERSDKEG